METVDRLVSTPTLVPLTVLIFLYIYCVTWLLQLHLIVWFSWLIMPWYMFLYRCVIPTHLYLCTLFSWYSKKKNVFFNIFIFHQLKKKGGTKLFSVLKDQIRACLCLLCINWAGMDLAIISLFSDQQGDLLTLIRVSSALCERGLTLATITLFLIRSPLTFHLWE